jgi:uncharacterized protein YoxC
MSVELNDLMTEKERLLSDRKVLLERLDEYQKAIQQVQTQIQAIGGAIQTCDYFINKFEQPSQQPESEDSVDVEENE